MTISYQDSVLVSIKIFASNITCIEQYQALNWIAYNLNLNENLAGITFVALGNGAPDIFGAMAAFTSDWVEISTKV